MELVLIFLAINSVNLKVFCDSPGLKKLQLLVTDNYLRHNTLEIFAIIAISSSSSLHIIDDLITILSTGKAADLDEQTISMRMDILKTIEHIFHRNDQAKSRFHPHGFTWLISVLNGIGQLIKSDAEETKTLKNSTVLSFLSAILQTLSSVIKGDSVNQTLFKEVCFFIFLFK